MTETILITGANRGIGLELAHCFSRMEWQVFACCRQPESAAALVALERDYPQLVTLPLDVSAADQITALVQQLKQHPIDILFHNAGIFGPKNQAFGEVDEAWWLETFRINTIAPLKLTEALVENVAASQRRIVAAMGSQLGSLADNTSGGSYIYRSSKAALHMVVRSLAADLAPRGITSVVFHPGWVKTRMGGAGAQTEAAHSADALSRLLCQLAPADNGKFFSWKGHEIPW
ncbi:MAG: short-chain dehydrogenase [Desulfuromonas sp.]|nr:MAG: short-chain dehydrogenase [Desulfuromonas sp.]